MASSALNLERVANTTPLFSVNLSQQAFSSPLGHLQQPAHGTQRPAGYATTPPPAQVSTTLGTAHGVLFPQSSPQPAARTPSNAQAPFTKAAVSRSSTPFTFYELVDETRRSVTPMSAGPALTAPLAPPPAPQGRYGAAPSTPRLPVSPPSGRTPVGTHVSTHTGQPMLSPTHPTVAAEPPHVIQEPEYRVAGPQDGVLSAYERAAEQPDEAARPIAVYSPTPHTNLMTSPAAPPTSHRQTASTSAAAARLQPVMTRLFEAARSVIVSVPATDRFDSIAIAVADLAQHTRVAGGAPNARRGMVEMPRIPASIVLLLLRWMDLNVAWEDILSLLNKHTGVRGTGAVAARLTALHAPDSGASVQSSRSLDMYSFADVAAAAINRHFQETDAHGVAAAATKGAVPAMPCSTLHAEGVADYDRIQAFVETTLLAPRRLQALETMVVRARDDERQVVPLAYVLTEPVLDILTAYSPQLSEIYGAMRNAGSPDTQSLATLIAHLCGSAEQLHIIDLAKKQFPQSFGSNQPLTYPRMCERLAVLGGLMALVDKQGYRLNTDLVTPQKIRASLLNLLSSAIGTSTMPLELFRDRLREGVSRLLAERHSQLHDLSQKLEQHLRRVFLHYCAVTDVSGTGLITARKFRRFVRDLQLGFPPGEELRYTDEVFESIYRQRAVIDPQRYPSKPTSGPAGDSKKPTTAEPELSFALFCRAVEGVASLVKGVGSRSLVLLMSEELSDPRAGAVPTEYLVDTSMFRLNAVGLPVATNPGGNAAVLEAKKDLLQPFFEAFATGFYRSTRTMVVKDVLCWVNHAELVPVFLSHADVSKMLRSIGTVATLPYNMNTIGVDFTGFLQLLVLICDTAKGFATTSAYAVTFKDRLELLLDRMGCSSIEQVRASVRQRRGGTSSPGRRAGTPSRNSSRSSTPRGRKPPSTAVGTPPSWWAREFNFTPANVTRAASPTATPGAGRPDSYSSGHIEPSAAGRPRGEDAFRPTTGVTSPGRSEMKPEAPLSHLFTSGM